MHGLCFATWASRIPSIQKNLVLTDAVLGAILFALPVGFFISLPFAGWLVSKAGSKKVVFFSGIAYSLSLVCIGASINVATVFLSLFSFGFFGNLVNISINTQAVNVERLFDKKLMSSFHGLWSLAGFAAAAIGTWMIGVGLSPLHHFIAISGCFLVGHFICAFKLVTKDVSSGEARPILAMPDKSILGLGIIAFCSMMAEGAMFDWSGVYFIRVVKVEQGLIGLGYTTFMIAMAATRFLADRLSEQYGLKRMLQGSGVLTSLGLLLAVSFPGLIPALTGFFLIGMGVSSVVPLVYSAVGKSKTLSPGVALAAVSSLGFMGLLLGPPLIGFIAEAASLRISFLAIMVMAIAVTVLATFRGNDRSVSGVPVEGSKMNRQKIEV